MTDFRSHKKWLAFMHELDDEMEQHFISWDHVTEKDTRRLRSVLNRASDERAVHTFLEKWPEYLIQHLGGGHRRWAISKQRLGAEYVPDFLIGESYSYGFDWYAVELESPTASMFTKNGDVSRQLNHAIRQIQDWRGWLEANRDYASRSRKDDGLGLPQISARARGLILIGRRENVSLETNGLRRQLIHDLRIDIHSYDFLVNSLSERVDALTRAPYVKTSRAVGPREKGRMKFGIRRRRGDDP
jgi:hypothetical protein